MCAVAGCASAHVYKVGTPPVGTYPPSQGRDTPLGWQFRSILGFVSADEQPGFKEPMHTHEEPVHIHEEPMTEQPMPAMPDQDERSAQWQQPEEEPEE